MNIDTKHRLFNFIRAGICILPILLAGKLTIDSDGIHVGSKVGLACALMPVCFAVGFWYGLANGTKTMANAIAGALIRSGLKKEKIIEIFNDIDIDNTVDVSNTK